MDEHGFTVIGVESRETSNGSSLTLNGGSNRSTTGSTKTSSLSAHASPFTPRGIYTDTLNYVPGVYDTECYDSTAAAMNYQMALMMYGQELSTGGLHFDPASGLANKYGGAAALLRPPRPQVFHGNDILRDAAVAVAVSASGPWANTGSVNGGRVGGATPAEVKPLAEWHTGQFNEAEALLPKPLIPASTATPSEVLPPSYTPPGHPDVSLLVMEYRKVSGTLWAFYSRVWGKPADMVLKHVCIDVPPLILANIIERLAQVRVQSLEVDVAERRCSLWLEDPKSAVEVVRKLRYGLWMSPFKHGYCLYGANETGFAYLKCYLEQLRLGAPDSTLVPLDILTVVP